MTMISPSEVRKLAGLSAITLTDDEVTVLSDDVTTILAYVDQLQELDTDGVEPTYQLSGLTNVYRDDVVENGVNRETLLSLAADTQDNHIKVPKVL
jgi:aspartyl-tRNA(Asn)/glutamyl-tRNA(Gln) amidotransferase subunit C